MKKLGLVTAAAALVGLFAGTAMAGNGNNLPKQPMKGSFHLQVIAFDICPAGDFTGSQRHMIAVEADFIADGGSELGKTQAGKNKNDLIKTNTIGLASSGLDGDFEVLDGNACAGRGSDGAQLLLPITTANLDCGAQGAECPDPDFTQYEVFVRLVGKPNSAIGVTTCAAELDESDFDGNGIDEEIVCSTENVIKVRETGKNKLRFTNESAALLTICLDTFDDLNFDGSCDVRLALFDPALEDYFWQWNTRGRPHAQLVFIPVL